MERELSHAKPNAELVDPLAGWLEPALAGDPSALRALLRALAPEIARVVRAMLGPSDPSLEDVVQDSLLALVRALSGFRRDCSARHFATRIAARTALRHRRRARAALVRDSAHEQVRRAAQPWERSNDADARRWSLLRQLVDELPERQSEVLALRFMLGYSLEETARAVDAPVNTVRSRIRLAKQALRERLEADAALARLFEERL